MYSWGGGTTDWKDPGRYRFDSARKPYLDADAAASAAKGGRSYSMRSEPDFGLVGVKNRPIETNSEHPIVFLVDGTGSMIGWPAEFFDRAPLLYQTLSQYRSDLEISFGVIGDATCDNYPIQLNKFGQGITLEDHIKALCPEGRGGGQISESYELSAYYLLNHCNMPKAKLPFLFVFGDEKFYGKVEPKQVKHYIGDKLQGPLDAKDVWKNLMLKFNVFFLQKPYGKGNEQDVTTEVKKYWADTLGPRRVVDLISADRAVDTAMAIVAKSWGQFGDFKGSMSARHDRDLIDAVVKSVRYVPVVPDRPMTRMSRLLTAGDAEKTKGLDEL